MKGNENARSRKQIFPMVRSFLQRMNDRVLKNLLACTFIVLFGIAVYLITGGFQS